MPSKPSAKWGIKVWSLYDRLDFSVNLVFTEEKLRNWKIMLNCWGKEWS
jgi:hypothetical protein